MKSLALSVEDQADLISAHELGDGERDAFYLRIVEEDRWARAKIGDSPFSSPFAGKVEGEGDVEAVNVGRSYRRRAKKSRTDQSGGITRVGDADWDALCSACIDVGFTYIGNPYEKRVRSNRVVYRWVKVRAKPIRRDTINVDVTRDAVSTSSDDVYSSRTRSARKTKRTMHLASYVPKVSLTSDQEADLVELKARHMSRVREV